MASFAVSAGFAVLTMMPVMMPMAVAVPATTAHKQRNQQYNKQESKQGHPRTHHRVPEAPPEAAAPAEHSAESGNVSDNDLVRPFAEGLDEARAEPLNTHAQQDEPAVSPSEPVQDESPASSTEADTHDNTEPPGDTGPVTAGDADSTADEPATVVLPDDRLDPIDAAVAAMPPRASEPAQARV
ncbi:MAG: hypothetical protein WCR49_15585, partial [Opitutae bacterium]